MTGAVENLSILFVGVLQPPPPNGGMMIVARDLLLRLAERGHHIRAIIPVGRGGGEAGAIARYHPGVALSTYDATQPVHDPKSDSRFEEHRVKAMGVLRHLIAEKVPDVILVGHQCYVADLSTITVSLAIPVVVWVHSPLAPMTVGDGVLSDALTARILSELRAASSVIVCADHLKPGADGLGLRRVTSVRNGIDLDGFKLRPAPTGLRTELDIAEDDVVVLHPTNLKRVKRGVDLVRSAGRALALDPRLVYVVTGEAPLLDEVEAACIEHGLAARFRFPGWVSRETCADLMALADMVVLTSEAEGLALAYLEAQASGTPLIASDIPAAREVIAQGLTGLLYPVGDAEALAACIVDLAASPSKRQDLATAALDHARRHHSIVSMVDSFEAELVRTVGRETRTP